MPVLAVVVMHVMSILVAAVPKVVVVIVPVMVISEFINDLDVWPEHQLGWPPYHYHRRAEH